jgi:tetratricopeptide (TPR) repeat protein
MHSTFRLACDDTVSTAEFLKIRGDELYEVKAYAEAAAHYEQSLKKEPNQTNTLNAYGVALYKAGENAKALEQINLAIQLKADLKFFKNRGVVLACLERFDEALEDFTKVLESDPWNMDTVKKILEVRIKMEKNRDYF